MDAREQAEAVLVIGALAVAGVAATIPIVGACVFRAALGVARRAVRR